MGLPSRDQIDLFGGTGIPQKAETGSLDIVTYFGEQGFESLFLRH
jgi:hypothetical protein